MNGEEGFYVTLNRKILELHEKNGNVACPSPNELKIHKKADQNYCKMFMICLH